MQRFIAFMKLPNKDWRHVAVLILLFTPFAVCRVSPADGDSSQRRPTSQPTAAPSTRQPTTVAPTRVVATSTPPAPTAIIDTQDPLSVRLAAIVDRALPGPDTDGKPRLVEIIVQASNDPAITGHRAIVLRGNRNVTNTLTVAGMLVDAVAIYALIAESDIITDLDTVTILFTLPLVDKYGNMKEQSVNRIQLTADTIRRVDWATFQRGGHRRLVDVAEQYVLNPVLR